MSAYIDTLANLYSFTYPFGPLGIGATTNGDVLVTSINKHAVLRVTSSGSVSVFAGYTTEPGSTDGAITAANFYAPRDVAMQADGTVYVADTLNYRVRKITTAGVVSTLAGSTQGDVNGTGTAAQFTFIASIAVDTSGVVYVCDQDVHKIKKITTAGVVSTLAGSTQGDVNGTGTAAKFSSPTGISVDEAGNVYVADSDNAKIKKITTAGVVSTLAGISGGGSEEYGTATSVFIGSPNSVAVATSGEVYFTANLKLKKVTTAGQVEFLAGGGFGGNDGRGTSAQFFYPHDVAVSSQGVVFVSDNGNFKIRYTPLPVLGVVTLSNLIQTYDGFAKIPTTTVSPSGLAVQLAYGGTAASLSAPVSAGSYAVTASIVNDLYYGFASSVMTISKASQAITFSAIGARFAGSGAFSISPSANSGLPVSLSSSNTSVATVSGFLITPITAGTTTISATQAGDINYSAAATVSQLFTVVSAPIAQVIDFPPLSPRLVANIGSIYQQALQVASASSLSFADAYAVAQANSQSSASFQLVATASSGLPVTFVSTDTAVANVTGNICTPVTPGVASIVASQAGNAAYEPASSVTRALVVVEKHLAWLDTRWDLTDLQVNLVTRRVITSRKNGAVLNIRQGDDHTLAIFLTDAAGAPLAVNLSALKITIREPRNRQPAILESETFALENFGGLDPYYAVTFRANNDSLQRYVAFSSRPDNSDSVPAIGQIEWVFEGKVYSSKTFSVAIVPEVEREFDEV